MSWISARAPTSTPRVGSSRIRIGVSATSQRATWTFCWLPPLSVATAAARSGVRMASCSMRRRVSVRTCAPSRNGPRWNAGEVGDHDVLGHGVDPDERVAAVLGDVPDAVARSLPRGEPNGRPARPSISTSPATAPGQAPKIALPDDSGAGADEAEQPDDLPAGDLEGHVVDKRPSSTSRRRHGESADTAGCARVAGWRRRPRPRVGSGRPEHLVDDLDARRFRRRGGRRRACRRASPGCGRRWRTPRRGGATRTRTWCRGRGRRAADRTGGPPRHRSAPRSARRGSGCGPPCGAPGR